MSMQPSNAGDATMRFSIYSLQGRDLGEWEGETDAHALAAMHRDAGAPCRVGTDGRIEFECSDPDYQLACGQVEDYDIVRIGEWS